MYPESNRLALNSAYCRTGEGAQKARVRLIPAQQTAGATTRISPGISPKVGDRPGNV